MSNDLVVKGKNEVSTELDSRFDASLQSAGDNMDAEDFRIPKITLIQALTKRSFNTEGVAVGNYINSIDKNDMGNTMDMFIMNDQKLWKFSYLPKGSDKAEYLTITDFGPYPNLRKDWTADSLPPEVIAKMEAKDLTFDMLEKPDLIYRFYVLLVDEVVEGVAFPYIVDFTRSSAGTGNKLKNIFFKMRKVAKLPSYAKVFSLGSEFTEGDKGDYYVKTASSGREISTEEIEAVESWIHELQNNQAKYEVAEDDIDAEAETATVVDAEVVNEGSGPKF